MKMSQMEFRPRTKGRTPQARAKKSGHSDAVTVRVEDMVIPTYLPATPDKNPMFLALDVASRFVSPYDINPFNINPLRDVLESEVDFEAVRACREIKLFISATNVRTGKVRVFTREEITPDVVMASACLPFMFKAVEISGTPYWDGGYVGNPPLFPFFRATHSDDIILVQTNPVEREEYERRLPGWIPDAADKAYVRSLMQRVTEPGKMAAWIAPPERGINNLALDYEYVRLS